MPREPFDRAALDRPPINDGGSAFPTFQRRNVLTEEGYREQVWPEDGMSLREWYAGKALFAVLYARTVVGLDLRPDSIADECYELADAMIRRNKETRGTRS